MTEHHFAADGYLAAQLPVAAAIAGVTRNLVIAPGLLAPLYHPLRLAEDLAAIDLLSGGRLVAGMGTGYRLEEYAGLGVPFEEAGARLEETLEILRLAATGEPFDYEGAIFHFKGVRITPAFPRPGGPPIVMMGASEAAANRAASQNAMLMCDPAHSWDDVARLVAIYDAERNGPELDLPIFCYGFIAESDPWGRMRDGFLHLRETYDAWMGRALPASRDPSAYRLLLGGRAEAVEQILACRDRFGDRVHLVLRLDYPGMDRAAVAAAIQLYGEVALSVRARTAAA
jgi:alkanesulfonate monooxygenase SsuD/methylene tetrahydromethanopterin reductase-like flavin-dependent oxidoreductase (luciferase family)